ncbi:MAG: site-2 protease family protein [Myxococcota bacterium]|jgi:Zn-dependent protease|nr:site-2 protease family protein [Myxococcota bacterium]
MPGPSPTELSGTPQPVSVGASLRRGASVVVGLGLAALTKGKALLAVVKLLPAGKLMLTSLSMFAMVAFEAQRTGLWFAVGFVLLILLHELGHGYAMKRAGVESGWPVFIPFIGALIAMKTPPADRNVQAQIAYGGPLAGTVASLVVAALGLHFEERALLALAYTGFYLNLFNLVPISPLDGGRIAEAFSRTAWIVGIGLIALMFFTTGAPQLLLIAGLALPRLFRGRSDVAAPERELSPELRRSWAVRYFGLAAFLGAAIYFCGAWIGRA